MGDPVYRREVVVFEILHEGAKDLDPMTLADIGHLTTEGHASGFFLEGESEVVDEITMARLLEKQGSDPGFLIKDEDVDKDWPDNPTRPYEFLLVHEDGTWGTSILEVPVELRAQKEVQDWVDNTIAGQALYRRIIRFIPWNEDPHA